MHCMSSYQRSRTWVHGNWMNVNEEPVQLEKAILALALRAKRKSTTAVAEEVAWLLELQPWQLFIIAEFPRGAEAGGGGAGGCNYSRYSSFSCSSFLVTFHKSCEKCCLNLRQLQICFKLPSFLPDATSSWHWRWRTAGCVCRAEGRQQEWMLATSAHGWIKGEPWMSSCHTHIHSLTG